MGLNPLLVKLLGGDLRSDGRSDEVVEEVRSNLDLFDDLFEGLRVSEDVVRGRTADALEKLARTHPELFVQSLPFILERVLKDEIPMVRWHLAMLLAYLDLSNEQLADVIDTLFLLLDDESVFVRSWAIVSLTVIGEEKSYYKPVFIKRVKNLENDESLAIKRKVQNSLAVLNGVTQMPKGWRKRTANE